MITIKSNLDPPFSWEIPNIKAVIFDKDGTLTNVHAYWGKIITMRVEALIEQGLIYPEKYEHFCALLGYDVVRGVLKKEGPIAIKSRTEVINKIVENLSICVLPKYHENRYTIIEDIFDAVHTKFLRYASAYIQPLDGVLELLSALKTHDIKIGLITSDSLNTTDLALKKLKIINYFDNICGKESSERPKEEGDLVTFMCKHWGIDEQYVVAIGDTKTDIDMAINSSISCISVPTGQVPYGDLRAYNYYTIKGTLKNLSVVDSEKGGE